MTFEMIKNNFDRQLWNAHMVAVAVGKGVITADQYTEITGAEYVPVDLPPTTAQKVAEHDQILDELTGV